MLNGKYQSGINARWVLKLAEYDFVLQHCAVPAADALSRAPGFASVDPSDSSATVATLVAPDHGQVTSPVAVRVRVASDPPALALTLSAVVEAQVDDPYCASVLYTLSRDPTAMDGFFMDGRCVRYTYRDAFGEYHPVVLPSKFQSLAIQSIHDSALTGHLGLRKTLSILRRQFYWPQLTRDVSDYVKTCPVCQMAKPRSPNRRVGALNPIQYDRVMQVVSADFIGPISPASSAGNRYVLCIVDNFSNLLWLLPTSDESAKTVAAGLLRIFLEYGFPDTLLSDRGAAFLGTVVSELSEGRKRPKRGAKREWRPLNRSGDASGDP